MLKEKAPINAFIRCIPIIRTSIFYTLYRVETRPCSINDQEGVSCVFVRLESVQLCTNGNPVSKNKLCVCYLQCWLHWESILHGFSMPRKKEVWFLLQTLFENLFDDFVGPIKRLKDYSYCWLQSNWNDRSDCFLTPYRCWKITSLGLHKNITLPIPDSFILMNGIL